VYKLNTTYRFSALGDYPIDIVALYNFNGGACLGGSLKNYTYTIKVVEGVNADFSINYNPCLSDSITLNDLSASIASPIKHLQWAYNNSQNSFPSPLDTLQRIRFVNPADNLANNFTLTAINQLGCFQKATKSLPIIPSLPPVSINLPITEICTNAAPFYLTGGNPVSSPGVGTGIYSGPGIDSVRGLFNPSTAGVGVHSIKYLFYNSFGCKDSAIASINVKPSITALINPVANLILKALASKNPFVVIEPANVLTLVELLATVALALINAVLE
jgi:hypothetical protein